MTAQILSVYSAIAICLLGCQSKAVSDGEPHCSGVVAAAMQGKAAFLRIMGTRATLDSLSLVEATSADERNRRLAAYLVEVDTGTVMVSFDGEDAESVFWTVRKGAYNKLRDLNQHYQSKEVREGQSNQ